MILFCVVLCITISAMGQIISVKSNTTQKPLELVTISCDRPKRMVITNSLGEAEISSFKELDIIAFRLLGYKSIIKTYQEIEAAGFQIFMEPTHFDMDVITISATKWNHSQNDITQKVSPISSKEIALQNPQTAADLLNVSGEVFIQKSQQGGGSPMIRGFSTNRLLYVVDGVRMNTAIFRSGNLQNVISLDPFNMEQTEVLFGPSSVIYGSDAIGGVMNFKTLTPQMTLTEKPLIKGSTLARYSSANNENTGHFDVNIGWKKWALISSVSSNKFGNLIMGGNGPTEYLRPFYVERQDSIDVVVTNKNPLEQNPSGYAQINMMQKIRFKPNDKLDIQYGFHYSETSNYDRYDRHIRYKKGLPRYGEWYYGPQKWMMNNLSIEHTGNNFIYSQMTIRLAHQFFEESRISRDINKNYRELRTETVNAYSTNLDFNKSLGKKDELFYGIELVYDDVTSTGLDQDISTNKITEGPARYPKASWASYAAYLTNQFHPFEKLMIQSGIRYNQYLLDAKFDTTFYPFPFETTSMNNAAITGSFGLVYRPTEKWVISSNASTGFRSPNVDDMGKVFDSEPGFVVVPNPNLHAENAYNVDFGIAKVFDDVVKVDFTGYYTLLKDALVRRDFTLNGKDSIMYDGTLSKVEAIQNAAQATVYGIQTGIEVKLPYGFNLSSRFNFQKGEEELDDGTTSPSRHAAPWFGTSRLTYTNEDLMLQFYVNYCGERKFEEMPEEEKGKDYLYAIDANGNPFSPSWYTMNFKVSYQINKNFMVNGGIENLTDIRYRPYSSGLVAPGRSFILSMKAIF